MQQVSFQLSLEWTSRHNQLQFYPKDMILMRSFWNEHLQFHRIFLSFVVIIISRLYYAQLLDKLFPLKTIESH